MKNLKRFLTIILITLIFALSLPAIPVCAEDADMRYGRKLLGNMANGSNFQVIYDQLADSCSAAKPAIAIEIGKYNTTADDIKNIIFPLFFYDYPEFFWLKGGWNGTTNGSVLTLKPEYSLTNDALVAAKATYNAKVIELTSGLTGSDYDKAKDLHDRLIAATEYKSGANDQTAYGALVEGAAVCNGYARAYQHLMNSAGIPTWYVRGTSINPATNTSVGHAWNVVKIDGLWYHTDVTWDDQGQNTFYAYFNVTEQQILKDHTLEAGYADYLSSITANSINANYYIKEGRCFEAYDQEKLVSFLNKDNNKTQIYINNIEAFKDSLNTNLLQLGEALGGLGAFQITYTYSQLGNAIILNVFLVSEDHAHSVNTSVQPKQPTCLSNGTKEYYICDCGQKFWDSACTQEVPDGTQLTIAATPHMPSDWQIDSYDHWKQCTVCRIETEGTRNSHTDINQDDKCDICEYIMSTDIDQTTDTPSEIENTNTTNSDNSIGYIDQTVSEYEQTYLYSGLKPDNAALKWIIISLGCALAVATIAVIIVIIFTKNKKT